MGIQLGSWLHFNEILSDEFLNKNGIYDCVAHYPLLYVASKRVHSIRCCPIQSRVYISDLDSIFKHELAPYI